MSNNWCQEVLNMLELIARAKTNPNIIPPTIEEVNHVLHFVNNRLALHHKCESLIPYLDSDNLKELTEIIRRCNK